MPIEIKNLTYTYSKKTVEEKIALKNVSLSIGDGEYVAIIGNTGSGKSTLIKHFNALTRLQEGELTVEGIALHQKKPDLKNLRRMVGMVFQYPEYQLFEDTVYKDVAFGPKNFGYSEEEIPFLVQEAIEMVGLDFEEIKERSPFELSRGQMRRVAIAGVIASKPKVLILDEPTSGLDPQGRLEILALIEKLKKDFVKTVIMVSHNMDEVAKHADRVIVLSDGEVVFDMPPACLFQKDKELLSLGLDIPHSANIVKLLREKGETVKYTIDENELFDELLTLLGGANV